MIYKEIFMNGELKIKEIKKYRLLIRLENKLNIFKKDINIMH